MDTPARGAYFREPSVQPAMTDGWSPRRTRLTSFLAVALGVVTLAALPAAYAGDPHSLPLVHQVLVLLASAAAGPLLIAWGVWTGWSGTARSLAPTRLLLAFALSVGLIGTLEWWLWVTAYQADPVSATSPGTATAVVGPPTTVLPYGGVAGPDRPALSPVGLVLETVVNPALLAYVAVGFAAVGSTARRHAKRAAVAGVVLSLQLCLLLLTVVLDGLALSHFLLLLVAIPVASVRFGNRFSEHREGTRDDAGEGDDADQADDTAGASDVMGAGGVVGAGDVVGASDVVGAGGVDHVVGGERPGLDVPAPTRPARHQQSSGGATDDRTRRGSLLAFVVGVVLLGLYPALHFGPVWTMLGGAHLAVAVASAVVGPLLVAWSVATAWTGRSRSLTVPRALVPLALSILPPVTFASYVPHAWSGVELARSGLFNRPPSRMLAFAATWFDGTPLAALGFVAVGVVLARYGPTPAVASLAVPGAILLGHRTLVAAAPPDPSGHVAAVLALGAVPFVVGYLAADADPGPAPVERWVRGVLG